MKKILGIEVIDVIPYAKGFLFVRREELPDYRIKVSFFSYNQELEECENASKSVYLINKFGPAYEKIVGHLGEYVSCSAGLLPGNNTFIIYSNGEVCLCDSQGEMKWRGYLKYHDCPAMDVAVENNHIWCVVPECNCLIRYSVSKNMVVMRIGSENSTTFSEPVSVAEYDNQLFVCSRKAQKISRVDLRDFTVSDYRVFDEPVNKYMRIGGNEYVHLDSGIYML